MSGQYLFNFLVDTKQKNDKVLFHIQFQGEELLYKKMTELANQNKAVLVYEEAPTWKRLLLRQAYQFVIRPDMVQVVTPNIWRLDEVLQKKTVIQLADLESERAKKSLIEELSAYASRVSSRHNGLFHKSK